MGEFLAAKSKAGLARPMRTAARCEAMNPRICPPVLAFGKIALGFAAAGCVAAPLQNFTP